MAGLARFFFDKKKPWMEKVSFTGCPKEGSLCLFKGRRVGSGWTQFFLGFPLLFFGEMNFISIIISKKSNCKLVYLGKWHWKIGDMRRFLSQGGPGKQKHRQMSSPIGSMYGIFIYLHLPYRSTKCREVYHTWILWIIKKRSNLPSRLGWLPGWVGKFGGWNFLWVESPEPTTKKWHSPKTRVTYMDVSKNTPVLGNIHMEGNR